MERLLKRPKVEDYEEPRRFLLQLYTFHRSRSPKWTLARLAKKAGFRSAGAVSMLLRGQRALGVESLERLAKALEVSGRDRLMLDTSFLISRESNPEDKSLLARELDLMRAIPESHDLQLSNYRFLSNWYAPVLYVLCGVFPAHANLSGLRARLGAKVSEEEVLSALNDMVELKLLSVKDGKYRQASGSIVRTKDDYQHIAIRRYHHSMLQLAVRKLSLPVSEREYNGATLSVPESEVAWVKQEIREFRKRIDERLTAMMSRADQVYQLNVQFFPVSQKVKGHV